MSKIGRVLNSPNQSKNKLKAFTLAEVLITLAIIGVVAALTIPTLVTSYQKKAYVTQLKKSYNALENGFKTYMANQGVTKLTDTTLVTRFEEARHASHSGDPREIVEALSKVLNLQGGYHGSINPSSTDGWEALEGNMPKECMGGIKYLNGDIYTNERDPFLSLADGTAFDIYIYYDKAYCGSKKCTSLEEYQNYTMGKNNIKGKFWETVGNVMIDINGCKGPNQFGRDVFFADISNDGSLIPEGSIEYALHNCDGNINNTCYWRNAKGTGTSAEESCGNNEDYNYGFGCLARIIEEGWEMKY